MRNGNGSNGSSTSRPVRCAIYTRKSTEEGLEQEFNSLDAQRESAEAYIKSQAHEGWIALPARYDDGGYSGATMERPALARLMQDIEAGAVDCITVYKVDRLSRSLLDFARLVARFEEKGVSFVSVTQQFNSQTSMGRLTLNMLLSFAQFEREVIAERIRDKFAASRKRGKHMGGAPVLGYDIDRAQKRLVVNAKEAKLVRHIFKRFLEDSSVTRLMQELNDAGHKTKAWTTLKGRVREGRPWHKGHLYRLLSNCLYMGEVNHLGDRYPGEHEAIVDRRSWDRVQALLASRVRERDPTKRAKAPVLLRGLARCAHCGCGMSPTFSIKHGKIYRYYLCMKAAKSGAEACPLRRVAARELEGVVEGQLRRLFQSSELLGAVLREPTGEGTKPGTTPGSGTARGLQKRVNSPDALEPALHEAASRLDGLWEDLFPAERHRIARLCLEGVEVGEEGVDLTLRVEGLRALLREIQGETAAEASV